jgi:hypothetical protein
LLSTSRLQENRKDLELLGLLSNGLRDDTGAARHTIEYKRHATFQQRD